MKREIKFRAWDKDNKEMFEPVIPFGDSVYKTVVIDIEEDKSYLAKFENAEIMQSTGLKDKNGKEIYEGDILIDERGNKAYIAFLRQEMGYVLVFEEHDSRLGHRNRGSGYDLDLSLEVIGNIHDNPELMEMKK